MPQGVIQPNNAILYAGQPLVQEMEVKTVTDLSPGKLCIVDTNDWDIKVAGADAANVLGVCDVPSDEKLTLMTVEAVEGTNTSTTEFTAKDQVRVLRGDIVVKLMAQSGETINVGTRLVSAACGLVKAATADSGAPEDIVGYSLESPVLTSSCKWVLVKLTI